MQRIISFCEQYGHVLAAVILTNVSLFTHLRVFRMYGPHPFGYDTGFYRRYLLEPFISFPNAPVPGLGDDALVPRMLLDVLRFVHLSPDVILYGSYVAFFVRSEEHTSELQSQFHLVCRLLLEKNRTYLVRESRETDNVIEPFDGVHGLLRQHAARFFGMFFFLETPRPSSSSFLPPGRIRRD